jgi:hypothetical protein
MFFGRSGGQFSVRKANFRFSFRRFPRDNAEEIWKGYLPLEIKGQHSQETLVGFNVSRRKLS